MPILMKPGMGDPSQMDNTGKSGDTGQAPDMGPTGDKKDTPEGSQEVIGAIQTLQTFILAQREKGNPQAEEMIQHFGSLLKSMQVGAGGEQQPPEAAPSDNAPPESQDTAGGSGQMSMNARKGAVPIM
jgi:hypothetical protein